MMGDNEQLSDILSAIGRMATLGQSTDSKDPSFRTNFAEAIRAIRRQPSTAETRYQTLKRNVLEAADPALKPRVMNAIAIKSPSAAKSSIAATRPGRQDADQLQDKLPERKPGETYDDFKKRVADHISTRLGNRASPIDAGAPDVALASEKSERGNEFRRRRLLANETEQRKARQRVNQAAKVSHYTNQDIDSAVRNLMRGRSQKVYTLEQLKSGKLPAAEIRSFYVAYSETAKELA